jgi:peptidoglycan glycosyltransferase
MTGAFATVANGGVFNRAHAIKRVLDSSDCKDFKNLQTCRVIYSDREDSGMNRRVLSENVADTMTAMFRGVVQGGTGRAAAIGQGEAGKTGTTNDNVDLWFIGYIPSRQILTGIWLGNDKPSPTRASSAQAAKLWGDYMRQVIQ